MTEQDVILLIGAVMIAAIVIGGILLWPSWRDAHIEQARLMAEMRPRTIRRQLHPFWISWEHREDLGDFELQWPWWCTGGGMGMSCMCAAVRAVDVHHAKDLIVRAYDNPPQMLVWRFAEPRDDNWSPFNDRFDRAEWMFWPSTDPACKHDWCEVCPAFDADFNPRRPFEICTVCHTIRNGN